MNKATVQQARPQGRTIGMVRGSAKIKILTDPMPLFYEEGEHPAVAYGRYVERMVRDLMDKHHQIPSELTIAMSFDEE